MKKDIVLGGVGGQGILSIAAIIGTAAVNEGLYLKQSEVHGMSQRGGDVMSNLRISSNPIYSDLIPEGKADVVLGVEPMEALRHLRMLAPDGWLVTNSRPFVNIPNYPDVEKLYNDIKKVKHYVMLDADDIAKKAGNSRASNVVMLGAALPFIGLSRASVEGAIKMIFGRKGEEVVNLNLKALAAGLDIANKAAAKA